MSSKRSIYITIIDPTGGVNMADGSPVAISHRVLCEMPAFYGYESIGKKVGRTYQDTVNFLMLAASEPSGTFGRFTWEHK